VSEYDDLLHEVRIRAETYRSTAKEYIPKMYEALRKEDVNISPEDARDRVEKDCFGIWSKRTILDAVPEEAKNPEKQKAGRLRQKGHNSAAFSAAQKRQDDQAVIIDVDGRAVETNVTSTLPTNDTAIRNSQQKAEKEKEEPPVDTASNKIAGSVVGHPSNYTTPDRKLRGIESEQREDSMKCVSQAAAKQEATVSPQPGPGIGIGGVGQQPICGYCPTKDSRITELEGVMKKKDHEIEQLNERIQKLEQKQKESSVTFEFSVPLRPLCNSLIAAVDSKVVDRFCFIGKLDIQSGKVIDVRYSWRGNQKESKI
jgi:hypothetical protein